MWPDRRRRVRPPAAPGGWWTASGWWRSWQRLRELVDAVDILQHTHSRTPPTHKSAPPLAWLAKSRAPQITQTNTYEHVRACAHSHTACGGRGIGQTHCSCFVALRARFAAVAATCIYTMRPRPIVGSTPRHKHYKQLVFCWCARHCAARVHLVV